MRYTVRPLDTATWDAFAELIERNNGIYGDCWCMAYHPEVSRTDAASNRLKCPASSTGAPTARTPRRLRTGGSPESSSTRGTAARVSRERRSRALSTRSRDTAADWSRRSQR